MHQPRVLIEEWLPAAAIGVECMRERGTGQNPPNARLHVWWARRPLVVSRAAVLGSILPADFPREEFEKLLGFWGHSKDILIAQQTLDGARLLGGRIDNPHGKRAFKSKILEPVLLNALRCASDLWGDGLIVIDPMAGGGSIPLESCRLGLSTIANEYNPVACSILEATVDYPFRFGSLLFKLALKWGGELKTRFDNKIGRFYPKIGFFPPLCYIFSRTVPCPDTGFYTPLVPDWYLFKPKGNKKLVAAEPVVDKTKGTWTVRIREIGSQAGQLREAPRATYTKGKGISLFSGRQIPADYLKAMAQAGKMHSALYAVAVKTAQGLRFHPPEQADLQALKEAEQELSQLRQEWEEMNIIPIELIPKGDKTGDPAGKGTDMPLKRGEKKWADMFAPRQLLAMGTLVEALNNLRPEIIKVEGEERGEAIVHLLSLAVDKFANWNALLSSWNAPYASARSVFDRHDFSFKSAFCELAPCHAGAGLEWAINNVLEAYEEITRLPRATHSRQAEITLGSATNLPHIADRSVTAVVVDPPYADNVQYAELADFFYVWLKRMQGHRRPEWFATALCDHDQETVVNLNRQKAKGGEASAKNARQEAQAFYHALMTDTFKECRRILRDDGVLTVMFTHKKQEAWEALFSSLIRAGFTINATWPVKTESEHSLHQAKKNAAQSTVILVARKRQAETGIGYFDAAMIEEIRQKARSAAERLRHEGLNAVDQLVGSFGPAMEVFSRYGEVRTDTGVPVEVKEAISEAADAVSAWRVDQLACHGLHGVEPEGRFYLLCWDTLGAEEFRFNEAKLLLNPELLSHQFPNYFLLGVLEYYGNS